MEKLKGYTEIDKQRTYSIFGYNITIKIVQKPFDLHKDADIRLAKQRCETRWGWFDVKQNIVYLNPINIPVICLYFLLRFRGIISNFPQYLEQIVRDRIAKNIAHEVKHSNQNIAWWQYEVFHFFTRTIPLIGWVMGVGETIKQYQVVGFDRAMLVGIIIVFVAELTATCFYYWNSIEREARKYAKSNKEKYQDVVTIEIRSRS